MQVSSTWVPYVFIIFCGDSYKRLGFWMKKTPTKQAKKPQNPKTNFPDQNYFSLLLLCHRTYSLESAYHMKFKLLAPANHVLHISIPYLFPFSSQFLVFPVSSFSNLYSYMWKRLWCNKDCWFSTKTSPQFRKERNNIFLHWTTHWGGSLSHQCLVKHIFLRCIHIYENINKITMGKQKRMTRGNLITASNYSSSQSSEECQETTKTEVYVSTVKYKEIFVSVCKDKSFQKIKPNKLGECF